MGLLDRVTQRVSNVVAEVKQEVKEKLGDAPPPPAAAPAQDSAISTFGNNILGAFKGVKQPTLGDLKQGVSDLKSMWNSPNKGAAISAEYEIGKVKMTTEHGLSRIDDQTQQALTLGVANPASTDGDRGQKGVLNKDQATAAAKTVASMDQGDYDGLKGLLDKAGQGADGKPKAGADAVTERALILKAVAARQGELQNPATRAKAMNEITSFANDVRGTPREELVRTTTAVDVQGAKNDDGLKQTFANSCAPTVAQLYKAEQDPVFARQLSTQGLDGNDPNSGTSKQQADVFNKAAVNGAAPVTRAEQKKVDDLQEHLLQNLQNQNERAEGKRTIPSIVDYTPAEAKALSKFGSGTPVDKLSESEIEALNSGAAKLKTVRPDLNVDEINKIAQRAQGSDEGKALNELGAGLKTHDVTNVDDGLKGMKERLKQGSAVPFSIAYDTHNRDLPHQGPGHALIATDFRDGKYLVSDPNSGKTAWVSEQAMRDGSFVKDFGLVDKDSRTTGRLDGYYS